ncbi:MAG: hypothetical protein ABIH27_06725 [Candidatus Omnitrophota bacterium]
MIENKKTVSVIACVLIVLFFCGCETVKGAAGGVAYGVSGVAMGVPKDASNFWHGLFQADDWIKKNLW